MKIGMTIVVLTILTIFNAACAQDSTTNDHFYTTALPEPDSADLFIIPSSILGTNPNAHLNAEAASALASLIRSQSIGQFGKRCFNPRYGIKFYRGGKLIAWETICFGCQWIQPMASDMHSVTPPEGFDATKPQAKQLQAYLEKAIPLVAK